MKKTFLALSLLGFTALSPVHAADYIIDTEKAHAFIDFRVQHLGYSWLLGRFNSFSGTFSYDADNVEASAVEVTIDVASVDSNFAERDKHLRERFLETGKFPQATFKSTSFETQEDGSLVMKGELTLRGVTKELTIPVSKVGEGDDPWGSYRAGFTGETQFRMEDFNIKADMLGPASQDVYLTLNIEGIRK